MQRLAPVLLASLGVGCTYGLSDLYGGVGNDTGRSTATNDDTGPWVTFDTEDTEDTEDTDPGTSPGNHKPQITAFTATEETANVRFSFTVTDDDDDMDDGWVTLSLGSTTRSYRWPQDLDVASNTQASTTWALDEFQPEKTETVQLVAEDSTGRTDSSSTSFTRATVINTATEVGDNLVSPVLLGEIPVPSEIEGTIWGCGNAGGTYSADTDLVRFQVAASKRYKMQLTWSDGGTSDLDLYLLDTNNQELNRSTSVWYPEEIGHDLVAGTAYQLYVACWSGGPGAWNLRITVM